MLEPEVRAKSINLRRGISLRIPLMNDLIEESELGLCRSDSLKISRANGADHVVAREARLMNAESSPLTTSLSSSSSDRGASCGSNSKTFRPIKRYAPGSDAPAPEYLARSLLQLGCPAVSMPTPRGGVGSGQPPSSDSDDYTTAHRQGAGGYGQNLDVYTVPKVQVSGPSNANESASVINGNKENVSAVLRISRNCKTQLLKNYEDALHWLRIRKSAIRGEQMSCVYHEEKTHLQMCESTSEW
ncbi:hypothetical protein EAG_02745 [Camponotus floridanus]|uniref:Uncharacterized protein n=1 Tax=Camponotus floridanus TaxID=104421 RepID=E2AFP7_CAMFO|nr:hypothetical protein EAG_02745 [Camponotus floridanus]